MQQAMTRAASLLLLSTVLLGAARADDAVPASTPAPAQVGETPASSPAPAGETTPPPPSGGNTWVLLLIMGAVMWFMVIRPQRKEEKAKKEMLSQLKKNDHVLTASGLYGVVAAVTDEDVVLKIDESKDVRVKLTRASVARVLTEDGAAKDAK